MTTVPYPMCFGCKRFRYDKGTSGVCDAYDQIPMAIWLSQEDHRKHIDGDHGLVFVPKDDKAAEHATELFSLLPVKQ